MLKILVQQGAGANFFIRSTWVNALRYLGHNVIYWNENDKSPLDVFYEFKPEIFIGSTWQLSSGIVKAIIKYKPDKVVLCGNNWGKDDEEVKKLYPIEFASDIEKRYVEMLKKQCGKPDLIVCQYHNDYAQETHALWKTLGCDVNGLLLSADVIEYSLAKPVKEIASDVVFVGGYWPYKSKQIAPYLFPLARPDINLNFKVFGFGAWPIPNFLGDIDSRTACAMYSSAKVCPNIFEPHSLDLGYDVNQRTYQIAAAGGFQICQNVESIQKHIFTNNEIVFSNDPEDFITKCLFYIRNPNTRISFIKNSIDTVYSSHTSLHRIGYLLNMIGYTQESIESYDKAEELYKKVKEVIQQPEFEEGYMELYS